MEMSNMRSDVSLEFRGEVHTICETSAERWYLFQLSVATREITLKFHD